MKLKTLWVMMVLILMEQQVELTLMHDTNDEGPDTPGTEGDGYYDDPASEGNGGTSNSAGDPNSSDGVDGPNSTGSNSVRGVGAGGVDGTDEDPTSVGTEGASNDDLKTTA